VVRKKREKKKGKDARPDKGNNEHKLNLANVFMGKMGHLPERHVRGGNPENITGNLIVPLRLTDRRERKPKPGNERYSL